MRPQPRSSCDLLALLRPDHCHTAKFLVSVAMDDVMAGFSDSDGEPQPSVLSPISAGIQSAAAATHVYPSTEKVGRIRPPLCRSTNQDTLASRLVLSSSDSDDEAAPAAAAGSLACRQPRSRAPTATSAAPVSGGVRINGHGVEDNSVELVVLSSDSDDGSDAGDVHRHTHPASSEQDISPDEPRLGVDESSNVTTGQSDGSPGSATLRFVPTSARVWLARRCTSPITMRCVPAANAICTLSEG